MIFSDIVAGAAVFVDANTFVYHFIADKTFGPACTALLDRIENQDIQGFTSSPGKAATTASPTRQNRMASAWFPP